jgi:Zn-dependent peptidase ImmA (M78 family)
MGLDEYPEVKMARKITKLHSLDFPIDLEALIEKYADLSFKNIPIDGVDGVCLNLKSSSKRQKVIVNSSIPKTRQRFTMAHELGHIIIPWHVGNIIDQINYNIPEEFVSVMSGYEYQEMEREANRFAAELLMPQDWIILKLSTLSIGQLHKMLTETALVSPQAAAFRLLDVFTFDVCFCAERNGVVVYSGKTHETTAFVQEQGDEFKEDFYPYIEEYSKFSSGSTIIHWWRLKTKLDFNGYGAESWREVLNTILEEVYPNHNLSKLKMSINGIVGSANSLAKRKSTYSPEKLTSDVYNKLRRDEYVLFYKHPRFEEFVYKRVIEHFK